MHGIQNKSSNLKKWLLTNKWDLLVWAASLFFLGFSLYPLLQNRILPGWDTTSHFYLLNKMVEYLKMGRVSGYDSLWFGGFPAFTFYGPLPYMIMALLFLGSGGLIGIALAFNLFIFALPILFLAAVYYTSRVWFGKNAGPVSLIFGTFFLTAVREYSYVGTGINSMIAIGLFASFFAICLMVLFLGVIENQRKYNKVKYLVAGAVLLSMLLLTHAMTTLFTLVLLGIFTLIHFKKFWKSALLMGLGSLILSSWWLVPFLKNFSLSSGQEIGMIGAGSDPLFVLYSFPTWLGENKFTMLFSVIPVALLLICSIIGIVTSVQGKREFLPWSFLLTLIVLPREYLFAYFDLPVHYYRFTADIYVLNIFLATAGALYIFGRIQKLKKIRKQIFGGLFIGVMAIAFLISYFNHLNLSDDYRNYTHKYKFEEYTDSVNVSEVMNYLAGKEIKNRVVVPTLPYFQDTLGSPHYFDTFLPLNLKISVIPGLLAESAISTQFVMPVVTKIGTSLNWGNTALLGDYKFSGQDMNSMIKRLGLYNVEYILLTKDLVANFLTGADKKLLVMDKEIGNFALLRLRDFRPFIEATNYRPFLYIDKGGMDFLTFSKEWFKSVDLFEMPVIYTNESLENLPEDEMAQIDGFIVSLENGDVIDDEELKKWMAYGKKLIFLNGKIEENGKVSLSEDVKFLWPFEVNMGIENVAQMLKEFNREKIIRREIVSEIRQNMRVKFANDGGTGGGTMINYSYFPNWGSTDEEQTIYRATPTMMWVFGDGETEIRYR